MSDNTDAAGSGTGSASIILDDYYVATEKTTVAHLSFTDGAAYTGIEWTAQVSGTTETVLSKTSGDTATDTIDITAPKASGNYVIKVTYKETIDTETTYEYTATATLHVRDPITLSVKVSNPSSGQLDFNGTVVFYVDGVRCDDSEQTLVVAVGETKTVEYKYYNPHLSSGKHTYYVTSGESTKPIGLDAKQTFYYDQGDEDTLVWLVGVFVVLLIIVAVWVFRKPVKNYGKPRARR